MKKILMLGAGLVMLGGAGIAMAQAPQPPAGGPPQAEAQAPRPDGERGPHRFGPGERGPHRFGEQQGPRRMGPPMMPPSRAAAFMIERGDTKIHVRCAENEPMQACVNAASALLDKVASAPAR